MNLGNKLDSSEFQDNAGAITPQGEHATTSEREKPKSKTKIQRFVAWVTKHEMTFDILEALQLAGQLPFFVLFFKFAIHYVDGHDSNIQSASSSLFYLCWPVFSMPPLPSLSTLNLCEL